jgi:alpha-N-arabinofuranosidase
MRPEYYADLYKRYSTFIRNYGDEPVYKIAGGPNVDDARWMEVLMQNVRHMANGISLHNYTFETNWDNKGDSLVYDENGWYSIMRNSYKMDKIVSLHTAIMDRYDPEKKVKLIVDEWGNWFNVMPGTNPGFLYQQNTIRDAVSAVIILHIFHNHCDRIDMANIAQMINVLQAVILTEGEKMVLTPTYYMFKMLSPHQDGELLDVDFDAGEAGTDSIKLPKISVSATEKDGVITVSMCNISTDEAEEIELDLRDADIASADGELLTADDMTAHNDFDAPDNVKTQPLAVSVEGGKIKAVLPPMSVAVISVK